MPRDGERPGWTPLRSSRFEGAGYRSMTPAPMSRWRTDLGVACGIAFDQDGGCTGEFDPARFSASASGRATAFADDSAERRPPSTWRWSVEQELFVTAPTLNAYDYGTGSTRQGQVRTMPSPLGRPRDWRSRPTDAARRRRAARGRGGVRFTEPDAAPQLVLSGGPRRCALLVRRGRSSWSPTRPPIDSISGIPHRSRPTEARSTRRPEKSVLVTPCLRGSWR